MNKKPRIAKRSVKGVQDALLSGKAGAFGVGIGIGLLILKALKAAQAAPQPEYPSGGETTRDLKDIAQEMVRNPVTGVYEPKKKTL